MTQGGTTSRNIGRCCAAVAIAVALAVCGVLPASADDITTGNRVFFRGGFAALNSDRGNELFTDGHSTGQATNDGSTGYYVGAGKDLMLTRRRVGHDERYCGRRRDRSGIQTVEFQHRRELGYPPVTGVSTGGQSKVQMTMLTVNVAPKVKFMQGSDFQPWVIPVGMDFHVISPPSKQTQYLDVGVQFGTGAEYRIWKELWLGVDGRYHVASNQTNTVNNYGTVGAYVAIGF